MRIITPYRVFLTGFAIVMLAIPVTGQILPDRSSEKGVTVVVEPFESDGENNAPDIAARTAWMLRRKLRAGKFNLPEPSAGTGDGAPQHVDWRISGTVTGIARDPDGQRQGPAVFGVARIPLKGTITVVVQNTAQPGTPTALTYTIRYAHPRLRVFGINRSPYPETTRAIDAMIHDTVMSISRDIIRLIQDNEQ